MSETVNVQFNGKPEDLIRAYDQLMDKNAELNRKLKESGDAGEDAGDRMGRGMVALKATVDLAKDALQLMNAEWEKINQNEQQAATTAIGFGQALRDVQLNLPDTLTDPTSAFLGIASRTGADPASVALAAGSAFSARGSLSDETTLATVEAAYQLNPRNAEQSNIVASMALDLMKSGEVEDPRAAIGFLSNLQQGLRLENISQMGQSFKGITNISQLEGNTREEAAELITTIQQVMGDTTGATATGVVNFANRLHEFPGLQGDTTARIAALQNDPVMRQQFIEQTSFDAQTGNVLKAWLAGDPAVMEAHQAAQGTIKPFNEDQIATYESVLARRRANPVDDIVQMDAMNETAQVQFDLGDRGRQIRGQAMDIFKDVLEDVNLPGYDPSAAGIMTADVNMAGRDPAYMAERLRSVATNWWESFPFGMMSDDDNARFLHAATRLDQAALSLERMRSEPPSAPVAIQRDRDNEGR